MNKKLLLVLIAGMEIGVVATIIAKQNTIIDQLDEICSWKGVPHHSGRYYRKQRQNEKKLKKMES